MKNIKKKDIINMLVLSSIVLIYVLITIKFGKYVYGSTYDWDSQHYAFPDYFRKLFYSTGNLFPNFSFNQGLGQNIYNFSYYGLLSPVVLFSYLLPFVSMATYIQIISIISVIGSSILMYAWFRKNNNEKQSLIFSIIFLCAAPILFQSHRHIMFIIYMPFLIMGLFGVDNYFEKNKKSLLALSVFLIILSNYYFSVGSILALVVYGIYKYIEKTKEIKFKKFIIDGIKFLIPILIGIVMSSIIILPTLYALFSGRDSNTLNINVLELLIPTFNTLTIMHTYSIGLSGFIIISLIDSILNNKRESRFLGTVLVLLIVFPIFVYVLNGTLYINYKVMIPFVPLGTIMISNTLKRIASGDYKYFKVIIVSLLFSLLFLINNNNYNYIFILEIIVSIILIFVLCKKKKNNLIIYFMIPIYLINIFLTKDSMYLRKDYENLINTRFEEELSEVLGNDDSIYRVNNSNYILQGSNLVDNINEYKSSVYSSLSNFELKNYYYNFSGNEITERSYGKLTDINNVFYNMFIGNKYLVSSESNMVGYTRVTDNIYKNDDVLPIVYGNKNIMSKDTYDNLSFPYNMEAQLKYSIVDKRGISTSEYTTDIKKIDLKYKVLEQKNIVIEESTNDSYKLLSDEGKILLHLNDKYNILMIKFKLNTVLNKDLSITINGTKNMLTASKWKYHNKNYEFNYVISSNDYINTLEILFSNGEFDISNLEVYTINYDSLKDIRKNIDEFKFDKKNTKGDVIAGNIDALQDEYVIMSIPYDKGFNIYIDNKETSYDKVNASFIGFPINKGKHSIRIEYVSPLFKEGKILSFIGFNMFIILVLFDKYGIMNYNNSLKRGVINEKRNLKKSKIRKN